MNCAAAGSEPAVHPITSLREEEPAWPDISDLPLHPVGKAALRENGQS
jgi:hypothetical protein